MIHGAARQTGVIAVLALLLCAFCGGCGNGGVTKPQAAESADAGAPVEKTVERGPVKMTVRADKPRISIAEKLHLTIEVLAQSGVDVQMPSFGEKLSEFEIMDFNERSAVPVGSSGKSRNPNIGGQAASGTKGRRWVQEYVLESFLSGELEVPAISVKFKDERDPAKPVAGEIASEPFTIQVASLLAGEFDPTKFRDIKGTVELPVDRGRAWIWWSLGAAGALATVILLIWLLRRRTRRVAVPRPLPPHEWAFFAFQRLQEDRLIESGRVREFYFRLSGIVREYIERRFGLMAPERTTPEFLVEVQADPTLSGRHKGLLGEFLQAADMVKFARYEPASTEVQAALETARTFVDQTTPSMVSENAPVQAPETDVSDLQRVEEVQA